MQEARRAQPVASRAGRGNSKGKDAPNCPLVKHTDHCWPKPPGSPGRDTSAGHMKLAYVLVFVGMISDLRIVAEIRS